MNNQSDDQDFDVQNLCIDESDVDASVELKSAMWQSKVLCTCRKEDEMAFKIWVGCPVTSNIVLKILMLNYFCLR